MYVVYTLFIISQLLIIQSEGFYFLKDFGVWDLGA